MNNLEEIKFQNKFDSFICKCLAGGGTRVYNFS